MKRPTALGLSLAICGGLAAGCSVLPSDITYHDGGGGSGGATTSSTSTASTTSAGTGGAPPHCPAPVSDELNGSSLDKCWSVLEPARIASQSFLPQASMTVFAMSPAPMDKNAWFQDSHGPFVYQLVTGDFILVARVYVGLASDPGMPPTQLYNTGGLLARDPASGPGNESWILYDLGRQGSGLDSPFVDVGGMAKVTIGSKTTKHPKDVGGSHSGTIALCRVGNTFQAIQRLYTPDQAAVNVAHTFTEWQSAPQTLQVGLIAGTWIASTDVLARFDYARFGYPASSGNDCLAAFTAVAAQMP
jgi:hypothetical protein